MPDVEMPSPASAVRVLLVSDQDWFASSLRAVLEPEGYVFVRVRTAKTALHEVAGVDPDIMIVDEGLPDIETTSLVTAIRDDVLSPVVPILSYSAGSWEAGGRRSGVRAMAWDAMREPLRPHVIIAKLRRLIEIRRLIEATDAGAAGGTAGRLFNLAGMMRMLRVMVATARRQEADLSCVVLGPSEFPEPGVDVEQRARLESLCTAAIRESDVCGWIRESDLGIVAFGADAAGATSLVRRLSAQTAEKEPFAPLSAGIAQIPVGVEDRLDPSSPAVSSVASRVASLSCVAAAQGALDLARQAGGGIRIADAG